MYTLITAAATAEAQRLKNKLGSTHILLGDYLEMPAFMKIIGLPNPASPSYTHEMLTLCLDKQIDTVYALRDEETSLLREAEQLFREYGITILGNEL